MGHTYKAGTIPDTPGVLHGRPFEEGLELGIVWLREAARLLDPGPLPLLVGCLDPVRARTHHDPQTQ